MAEPTGNILIGQGEKLIENGDWSGSTRPKPLPYAIEHQRSLFGPTLDKLAQTALHQDPKLAPRREIAAKFTIHPEFLAKSYFPTSLLKTAGLRLLGSRAVDVTPRKMVRGKAPKRLPTAMLIVAGSAENFVRASTLLADTEAPQTVQDCFNRLESIDPFLPQDRKHGLDYSDFDGNFEVVLHASVHDPDINRAFFELARGLNARFEDRRARTIGGLTFLPLKIEIDATRAFVGVVESFTHLRAIRNMPVLTDDPITPDQGLTRSLAFAPPLPQEAAIDESLKAVIFDGGFTPKLLPWVNALDAPDLAAAQPNHLEHGHAVTSAFLFGAIGETQHTIAPPYCNVDHVRVLPSTSGDMQVADVIDRIISTLQTARDSGRPYSLANLSLGPRVPILDDDPHEWTVRLDDFLSFGDLFMTIAVGNDGNEGTDLGRIQPPGDAVNAFAVGASDGHHGKAARAFYSCVGPGRSPGLVKPDAVAFGGSATDLMRIVDPTSRVIRHRAGTSYAAPLALRLAAGVQATVHERIEPIMLHALLVSRAQFNPYQHDQTEVGWGVLPATVEEILYSPEDEVVVMYQGLIAKGSPLKAKIPLPPGLPVELKPTIAATFAYRAPVDPAHPVSYTRAGLEIRFKPDGKASASFFSKTQFDTEQTLRADALKWETCRHHQRRIPVGDLTDPCFVIRYQGRDEGAADEKAAKDTTGALLPAEQQPSALPFALIVRLKVPGVHDLSSRVLGQFKVLSKVMLRAQIQT
ncbi:MAG: S8 family serine peptidase [Acidovorax sp.]|uniref:S8 family serine peptidase n=1 Tax=Acidovorax sp. TaxID=1872122 RepID=UPI0025C1C638|nr:S8 family serine peptidase [Acidovorax sp.]MCE1194296.1 S8 family serine peptidase [Acidovorax sp.]